MTVSPMVRQTTVVLELLLSGFARSGLHFYLIRPLRLTSTVTDLAMQYTATSIGAAEGMLQGELQAALSSLSTVAKIVTPLVRRSHRQHLQSADSLLCLHHTQKKMYDFYAEPSFLCDVTPGMERGYHGMIAVHTAARCGGDCTRSAWPPAGRRYSISSPRPVGWCSQPLPTLILFTAYPSRWRGFGQ